MITKDFFVPTLGKCKIKSPLHLSKKKHDGLYDYVLESERILYDDSLSNFKKFSKSQKDPLSFEKAGPREFIFFDTTKTKVAIVTCGGLCPGINNVIRSLVMQLHYFYNVTNIIGIKYGFQGFIAKYKHPVVELTPKEVEKYHLFGGSMLGSSRGEQPVDEIVDFLENNNINILFTIGGDGTLKGSLDIHKEIEKRNLKISVANIPKTIDNDIGYIEKSFGYETAFSSANPVIRVAHNEAKGYYNGIALVKLMGRDSGFIAAKSALSMQEVNFVLIPELDFDLEGAKGFLETLRKRLAARHHAVIVVAEGAGQKFIHSDQIKKDASGNIKHEDIGTYLKEKITQYFKSQKIDISLKYIDPSYIIRSEPANPNDSIFCSQLARNAVHGAMAGKTAFVTGIWNNKFTYLPIPIAIKKRNKIDLESELWYSVLESTGQPIKMKN